MDQNALSRLAAEHLRHALDLDRLDRALAADPPDYETVREQLSNVDATLGEHLKGEEALLLPWLSYVLPERLAEIEQLQRDHIEILASATVLRLSVSSASELTPPAANAVRRYAGLLRKHLDKEEALIAAASVARNRAARA